MPMSTDRLYFSTFVFMPEISLIVDLASDFNIDI